MVMGNQKQTATSKPYATSETVKFLFGKFYARYGAKWSSQYPDEMMPVVHEEWLHELNNITLEQIKKGLKNWSEAWPPNIVEFVEACTKKDIGRPAPCYVEYETRALPAPTNKELGRQAIKEMKAKIIGG